MTLSPLWVEAEEPPASMPPEIQPRVMRQPPSAALLVLLLLLAAGVLVGGGVALWSAFSAPVGAGNMGSWTGPTRSDRPVGVPVTSLRLPEVAPNTNLAVPPEEARELNAKVPFVPEQLVPATPFTLPASGIDRERAITCLAAAAYYEAGDDPAGMAAVAQVVLNRVRHPAFPSTVCGVVFQGAERRTGCQFTFTCDGALARPPAPAIWRRARQAATLALTGFVFRAVGQATHYHTDWVVPYWSAQLVKIAQVHTHLFFRWPGTWGGPGALRQSYGGVEAIDPRIAGLMEAPKVGVQLLDSDDTVTGAVPDDPRTANQRRVDASGIDLDGNTLRGYDRDQASFLLQLAADSFPGSYAVVAYRLCKDRTPCRVAGWRNPADVPSGGRITSDSRRSASFLYERLGPGNESARWNCREIPRDDPAQCIVGTR